MPKIVILWTDVVVLLLVAALGLYVWQVRRSADLRMTWRRVFQDAPSLGASVLLLAALTVTLLDSLHFRPLLPAAPGATAAAYDTRTWSVLDLALLRLVAGREATYSEPLACEGFTKESIEVDGQAQRMRPRLQHACIGLNEPAAQRGADIARRVGLGLLGGGALAVLLSAALVASLARRSAASFGVTARELLRGGTALPWRAGLAVLALLCLAGGVAVSLSQAYHVLGTDRTGNDVLVQCLKSIRTAFVIGTLSTIATLPLAVGLGIAAGYLRGWVDEVVQYLYTMLSSVPNVLLIAACVLMVQVFLDKNPDLFETGAERADLKLFLLCAILGLTGWAGLCRLLRAETMKLRELEYVQAATAFGVGDLRIMVRHIFPNVAHLMLITTVLDFCALVLYEAVLSYVGVGVDPSMNSFGGMINVARTEMSRDPLVWWSFASAFGFMVTLVLAANLFADGVQNAFDPRARVFRPRLSVLPKKKAA
jgi:peptide/nickel transport system permease protein